MALKRTVWLLIGQWGTQVASAGAYIGLSGGQGGSPIVSGVFRWSVGLFHGQEGGLQKNFCTRAHYALAPPQGRLYEYNRRLFPGYEDARRISTAYRRSCAR